MPSKGELAISEQELLGWPVQGGIRAKSNLAMQRRRVRVWGRTCAQRWSCAQEACLNAWTEVGTIVCVWMDARTESRTKFLTQRSGCGGNR